MAFTNYGLEKLGSWIRGETVNIPGSLSFGHSGKAIVNSESHLGDEFYRKEVTWTTFKGNPQFNVTLTSVEANGSYIGELGLGSSEATGSDLYFRSLSAIGSKNNTFDVDIRGQILFRRG